MRYFYNKKTNIYVGRTSEATPCPKGCGETSSKPDNCFHVFDKVTGSWIDKLPASEKKKAKKSKSFNADEYAKKVSAYSDKQLQGACIRAKGEKLAILKDEKAYRENR